MRPRCGALIRREHFMNRSSFSCPSASRGRGVGQWPDGRRFGAGRVGSSSGGST